MVEASMRDRGEVGGATMPVLLAPLRLGDVLPWRLGPDGEPEWLTVVEVVGGSSYRVRYPDGTAGVVVDSG
jgi:hypothetical protein